MKRPDVVYDIRAEFPEQIDLLQNRTPVRPERFDEHVDPQTGFYPIETNLIEQILDPSKRHMTEDELELTTNMIYLGILAHANQNRGTGLPFSFHPLTIAKKAADYEMDTISIGVGSCHDVDEDTMFRILDMIISLYGEYSDESLSFANSVRGLTILRSRYQSPEESESEYLESVIGSTIRNPRIGIFKVFDTENNSTDLDGVSRNRRLRFVRRSYNIMRLAQILGMRQEADTIARNMVRWQSSRHERFVYNLDRFFAKVNIRNQMEAMGEYVANSFAGQPVQSHVELPNIYDIYQSMGTLRQPVISDICPTVVLGLNEVTSDDHWESDAVKVMFQLMSNRRFTAKAPLDMEQIKQDRRRHNVSSLSFGARDVDTRMDVSIRVCPSDVYEHLNSSLVDLYRHHDYLSYIQAHGESILTQVPEQVRRAYRKYRFFQKLYEQAQGNTDMHLETTAENLVTVFSSQIQDRHIRVIGVNYKGIRTPWDIERGATILDYAHDIAPTRWATITGADVNGNVVPYNYVISHGDTVQIVFDPKGIEHWDHSWVRSFVINEDGKKTARKHSERILNRDRKNGLELSDDMKEVLQYGFDIVDDTFVLLGTTCMIRLDPMLKVAQSMIIETQSVEDLLIKIGLGHISDEQLKELVSAVLPINRKAGYIDLYFQKDRPGQSAVVTAVMRKLDISATRILAEALGEDSYAKFTICFDPSDMPRIEEVVETLANDPICKNLGLIPASIRIHKNTSRKK
ncbi:MAG: (P)ppGpp synthetase I [Microgenomates group bacterium GW2011_GWC1_41_8]|uniref:(P)ppGpp synthetase I n=3 Tax=Candidatus Roizmaniibacteriota TaxID=1752723 RepID=A0A0G0X8Q1_9BACT|nr:MAG: (P)ppGpp synthetase I [Candidatus Levybacteria bacterium GW2011_GWA2_40_16]KKR71089.1 MAG: (P)ppGpp synthetase I [Candidatus Roizmanbacteria bacterium GW2011_GWB1_40_7]KKR91816.1 MAG: (P)ppGpp synthetase I [Candidatus Roizmanbacteria bacterium GW2011_GWA1_41_13]KKS20762.1 MAG: (P)ppGpp synthetase I [Candidatus Roizmanbacteria bacterium GW2011_GWC2_41_7]KKS24629.1 MAG: (P)ppGpp synthetase I [Microgenomates group bacterium GW2011_GWC1_41_8]